MKKGFFSKTAMWMYNNGITTNTMLKMLFKEGLQNNNLTKQEIEGYKRPLLENKTRGMYYFFTQTCNNLPDYSSVFKKATCPVQFIWGQNDRMLQINPQLDKIKDAFRISETNIHILKNTKHFIQEEEPLRIANLLINFHNKSVKKR